MPKRRKRKQSSPTKVQSKLATDPEGWVSPAVVLFADIVGCSEISNHEQIRKYNEIIGQFQDIFKEVCEGYKREFYPANWNICFQATTRGDEGCLMIFRPAGKPTKPDYWADDIDTAINIALELKRRWIVSKYNTGRIHSGRLPADLAIGIHFGKAYINRDANNAYRPEGYTINLTKRIENHSRDGMFTHIDVSEAAHDHLYLLTDEAIYTFAPPRRIRPEGISQGLNVFEVKHHFLPTDWNDDETEASKWRYSTPTSDDLKTIGVAHESNPTSLWVAEECIMLEIQQGYSNLRKDGQQENDKKLKKAYGRAEDLSRKLANGSLRDAGSLAIVGFIVGEYSDYAEEQSLYEEAITLDGLYAEAHWYLGYSMSVEVADKYGVEGPLGKRFEDLEPEDQEKVKSVLRHYSKAMKLKPWQVWMKFDMACEQWRWAATRREKQDAVGMLEYALSLDPRLCEVVKEQPYLEGIDEQTRIKSVLKAKVVIE